MVRRVVTGHKVGRAVFVGDGVPPRTYAYQKIPGFEESFVWATTDRPEITFDGIADLSVSNETRFLPRPGETRLIILKIPPDSVRLREDFDAAGAAREIAEHQPEMAATREADDPRMHRTDTVDYVIVLDGEIYLELDDRQEVLLKQNDVLIQNGTRHAWRNKGGRPATLAVVLVGAQRAQA